MKILIIIVIAILFLGGLIYSAMILLQLPNNDSAQKFLVVDVIDGDTFEIATGEQVRLICIDGPEKGEVGYKETKDFLSNLILEKEVRLEQDIEDQDKYGRLLRYVYLNTSKGELFINKEIVQQGYGEVFPYGNNTLKCEEINGSLLQ